MCVLHWLHAGCWKQTDSAAQCHGNLQRSSLSLVFSSTAGVYHSDIIGYTLYSKPGPNPCGLTTLKNKMIKGCFYLLHQQQSRLFNLIFFLHWLTAVSLSPKCSVSSTVSLIISVICSWREVHFWTFLVCFLC